MIPYGRQSISDDDVAAVIEALRSDWLTTGPKIDALEGELRAVTGAAHAVAFANGTAALHAAAAAAGLGPGATLATTALSFAASATCARYVGATPVLVDVDEATMNIDLASIPACDALVPVHYTGLPVDLAALASRPRIVIEDAAHALGAVTPDGPVGSCARSDLCTFSFHPVKHVTTGEGGAVTTNDDDLALALRRFRNHGIVHKPEHGAWYYEIERLGFNYRLTDIQAALGVAQLGRLEQFVVRRNELAERYRELLADAPVVLPPAAPAGFRHAYHLFVVRVAERRRVFDELRAAGIGVQVHYVPIYRHPLYADLGIGPDDFPATERVYDAILSIPLFPDLTEREQDSVVEALRRAVRA